MRDKPSPVDAVCRRQHESLFFQRRNHIFVAENAFDRGLCVVEITFYSENRNVFPFLRTHLQFLHFAHAVFGIKHDDIRTFDVLESFQRGFPRISACRDENKHLFLDVVFLGRRRKKVRQKRQRDVLKSKRRAVEQF